MIQLAFSTGNGALLDQVISKDTHSKYVHVELYLDGSRESARCFSSRSPDGASFMVQNLMDPEWEIVRIPWADKNESIIDLEEYQIEAWCDGANGMPYDFPGLVGDAMKNGLHNPHARDCSATVAACLAFCCGLVLPKPSWEMSPGDLYTLVTGLREA